ncbi:MAG: DUF4870 domain-containing protein [Pyrinomonadaceae bacterium]
MENPSGGKTALGLDANVGALLCYLPICAISLIYSIIVLVTDKDNRLVRFHAFQSLLLTGVYIVLIIGVQIVSALFLAMDLGIIGLLLSLLFFVVVIGFLGAMIFGMVKGYQGQKFKFPVVGDMAEKWANG